MTTEQMDEVDAMGTDREKELPREPDLGKRLEAIGALRTGVGDENEAWVNCPLSIVLEQVKGARADEETAWLITPHGEKVPIPSHIAEQIRAIEYRNDQALRIQIDDQTADGQAAYFDGDDAQYESDEAPIARADVGYPVEDPESRVLRAYGNGYVDGLRRGSSGRFDHS